MGITPWENVDGIEVLKIIEREGRVCYKSENKITSSSAIEFVRARIKEGHIALLDGISITANYISDRGFSHEYLRHKLTEILPAGAVEPVDDWTPFSVSQESTRYCNYMKKGGVCFIIPPWIKNIPEGEYKESELFPEVKNKLTKAENLWLDNRFNSEYTYFQLLKEGWTPEMSRGDLLIGVKTEFNVTCTLTEWRHVMKQRSSKFAHPQMTELMRPQLEDFKKTIPIIFDDITY